MKRFLYFITAVTALSVILSACGGDATQLPIELPTEAATATIEVPPPTEPPVAATVAPAMLVSIDLAGPPMQLGSRYTYVDGTVLVAVPGGPFIMGYNFADNPEREVTVGDFWIYSTKVTNQQYALCVQLGKCTNPDPQNSPTYTDYRSTNHPVTGVNHAQAAEYCSFVHGRLPTEAEWEKTARGPEGNIFPWGDGAPTCSLLNYKFCVSKTTPVTEYKNGVSYYGALDMSGNAREWAADWYSPTYNVDSPVADPLGPELGEKRSVRGSSYQDSADPSISAHRFSLNPIENLPDLGFRCVVEDPTYFAPWCEQLAYAGPGLDGSQPDCNVTIKCNDVSISQAPNCTPNFTPYTIVTFKLTGTPPDAWDYQLSGCSALAGEQTATQDKFECFPGDVGPAVAVGSCNFGVQAGCQVCPANYNLDGSTCVWDGSGTAGTVCLPGSTYDPLAQCCTSLDGSGTNFGLCPAGTHPLNGVCVDNPKAIADNVLQAVLFADNCAPPPDKDPGDPGDDDDDGNSCSDPGTCRQGTSWDFSSCMCCGGFTNYFCYTP